jgi:multimeric flavodoxin WrbA
MTPKAFVLFGSPRHDGYTAQMLECFFSRWDGVKKHSFVFDTYKSNIKPCVHCGHCKKTRGCIYDDFIPIDKALNAADLLIIASPVYGLGFPAPMKAVFDRTQQYFEAKFSLGIQSPIPKNKAALFFAAYGSKDDSGVEMMKKQLDLVFRLMNATLIHTVVLPDTDNMRSFDERLINNDMNEAARKAEKYLRGIS